MAVPSSETVPFTSSVTLYRPFWEPEVTRLCMSAVLLSGMSFVHAAFNVMSLVTGVEKSYFTPSRYQPANVQSERVGAVGSLALALSSTVWDAVFEPPFASNVTVWLETFHCAYRVRVLPSAGYAMAVPGW